MLIELLDNNATIREINAYYQSKLHNYDVVNDVVLGQETGEFDSLENNIDGHKTNVRGD